MATKTVADWIVERLSPIYPVATDVGPDVGSVQELLNRWWAAEGNAGRPTNQKLYDRYVLAGAQGASLQDKAYDFWSNGLLKSALRLPGITGNYLSTPDSVVNSITGDIDIRIKLSLDDWTPATINNLISKQTTGSDRVFYFQMNTNGQLGLLYSTDGSSVTQVNSGAPTLFADGAVGWVRVILDVDNGAGGRDVKFYISNDGLTWAQLGSTSTTAGIVSLFDSTAPLAIGARGVGGATENLAGTVYYAEVRNGIDGPIVASFDAAQVQVTGQQLPASINGWTFNGSALYQRDDYVRLPGTSGNYLSFPDTAVNRVTGDIDLVTKLALDDFTPAAELYFLSKYDLGANQRSWALGVVGGNLAALRVIFYGSSTGANQSSVNSTDIPAVDGKVVYLRVTRVASSGLVSFYYSFDGTTWVAAGTGTVLAGANLFASNSEISVGSLKGGTNNLVIGNVYYAEVRNGINGAVVASFDARTKQTPWTINGSGWNWQGANVPAKPVTVLSLPGTNGNYASTPDDAVNSVVGDIDLRVKLSLPNWQDGVESEFLTKWNSGTNQRSYRLYKFTDNKIYLGWSTDGTSGTVSSLGDTVQAYAAGQVKWIRATLVVATGAWKFYDSDDGIAWSLRNSGATGATSIFDSTSVVEIGSLNLGTFGPLNGKIYYAEVRNGIDGPIVAKFDATAVAKTGTRTPTTTVQPGGNPNMLTPNEASIETDATGWNFGLANCTIARDTSQFLDGAASLAITSIAAGNMQGNTNTGTNGKPVVAGKSYTLKYNSRAATVARTFIVVIRWYKADGTASATSTVAGSGVNNSTGAWTVNSVVAVAPSDAAFAAAEFFFSSIGGAGEVHYIDRISLVESAEVWTLNGSAWDWSVAA